MGHKLSRKKVKVSSAALCLCCTEPDVENNKAEPTLMVPNSQVKEELNHAIDVMGSIQHKLDDMEKIIEHQIEVNSPGFRYRHRLHAHIMEKSTLDQNAPDIDI